MSMAWVEQVIASEGFWALAGVVAGVVLGEGVRWVRELGERRKQKRVIQEELRAISGQIAQKINAIEQMIRSLTNGRYLPGRSVAIVNLGYRRFGAELYPHLSPAERNTLHVVHERLRIADDELDRFEENFQRDLQGEVVADPFAAAADRLGELRASYRMVDQLIRGYLAGQALDVFASSTQLPS